MQFVTFTCQIFTEFVTLQFQTAVTNRGSMDFFRALATDLAMAERMLGEGADIHEVHHNEPECM